MITGFEEETEPLTEQELVYVDAIVTELKHCKGENNSIKSDTISDMLFARYNLKPSGARVRKLISHIRLKDLVPLLVATSKGYYIETDPDRIDNYIRSLNERADAILAIAKRIEKQKNESLHLLHN